MPKSKSFETTEQRVQRAENSIRHEKYETMIMFDENGNEIDRTTQHNPKMVQPTLAMANDMANRILSHNHPSGSCFSQEDIGASLGYGVREIRATTDSGLTYCLRRNFELGTYVPWVYTQFAKRYYEGWRQNWRKRVYAEFDKGNYAVDQSKLANDCRREWLRRNASKYGWTYREEYNNG